MFRRTGLLISVALVIAASTTPVAAQEYTNPFDWCIAVEHFPDEPIGDAPSKVGIYATFPPEYSGGIFEFGLSGASGDVTGSGPIDGFGIAHAYAPLFSYGTHVIVSGYVRLDGMESPVDPATIGDEGTFVVNDSESVCDPDTLTTAPPATTTVPSTSTSTPTTSTSTTTTSTTTTSTTPASTATPSTVPTSEGESTDFPWPVFLIGFGLLFILGGVFLARSKEEDSCEPLRIAWQADEDRWKQAKEALAEFQADLEKRRQRVKDLEAELAALERAAQTSTTIDGLERHLIDGGLIDPEHLAIQTGLVIRSLDAARAHEADADQTVQDWEKRVADERAGADASKAAYEECIGTSLPGVSDGGGKDGDDTSGGTDGGGVDVETGGGGTVVDGGPSVAAPPDEPEEEKKECEDGDEETGPGGSSDSITVVVDFSIIVEAEEGSERKIGEAKDMAFDLNDTGNLLDAAGKLLGGFGAGRNVVGGIGAMRAGKYVMGAKGLAEGAADAAMATDLVPVSVPTSPPEAMAEFLEQTAKLGALVSSKVGEWLEMNELYEVRLTYFTQTITAVPFERWACEGDKMVCRSKFWEYTVGGMGKRSGTQKKTFRLESDRQKHLMDNHIRTLSGIAQREIESSVQKRIKFDQAHRPKPCDS